MHDISRRIVLSILQEQKVAEGLEAGRMRTWCN